MCPIPGREFRGRLDDLKNPALSRSCLRCVQLYDGLMHVGDDSYLDKHLYIEHTATAFTVQPYRTELEMYGSPEYELFSTQSVASADETTNIW